MRTDKDVVHSIEVGRMVDEGCPHGHEPEPPKSETEVPCRLFGKDGTLVHSVRISTVQASTFKLPDVIVWQERVYVLRKPGANYFLAEVYDADLAFMIPF